MDMKKHKPIPDLRIDNRIINGAVYDDITPLISEAVTQSVFDTTCKNVWGVLWNMSQSLSRHIRMKIINGRA